MLKNRKVVDLVGRVGHKYRTLIRPVLLQIYLLGYQGYCPTRLIRRAVAGTEFHRAWLAGYRGIYTEVDDQDAAGVNFTGDFDV